MGKTDTAEKKQITAGIVARKLMQRHHFATIKGSRNEDVLIYNERGTYEYGGENVIKEQTQELCGDNANVHFVSEVIGHIRRSTYIDQSQIDEGDNVLNVANGLVNMHTRKLVPHTHTYHSFIQIPVTFDPDATCPKAEAFINSVFNRHDREIIKEFIGFLFIKKYLFHKALMITGQSHTGKTTFVNMVMALIGQQNIASVTLQDLCDKPFSLAELHKKLANISDDLPANPVRYSGQFKRLTGESIITAERKFKDPFIFTNCAKAIFTCNELPLVQAGDDAYFYRWLIVETASKFNGNTINRNMLNEITTPQELSGLLNMALQYREKLITQNDFTNALDVEQSRERYMLAVRDSVAKFLTEHCQRDGDGWIAKQVLYDSYQAWCEDAELPSRAPNAFHRRFQRLMGSHVTEYSPVYLGSQIRAYKGIKFKENGKG